METDGKTFGEETMGLLNKGEFLSGIGLLLVAGFLIQEAVTMPLGKISNPGAGFIPLGLGGLLGVLSLILVIRSCRNKGPAEGKEISKVGESKGKVLLFIILSLVGYAFLLERIGFFFSTFLLMAAITYLFNPGKVFSAIVFSLLTAGVAYFLFSVLLKVTLP